MGRGIEEVANTTLMSGQPSAIQLGHTHIARVRSATGDAVFASMHPQAVHRQFRLRGGDVGPASPCLAEQSCASMLLTGSWVNMSGGWEEGVCVAS